MRWMLPLLLLVGCYHHEEAAPVVAASVLMIGDSNAVNGKGWPELLVPPDRNLAVNGSDTQIWINYASTATIRCQVLYIFLGTNDRFMDPGLFAERYRALLNAVEVGSIICVNIPPSSAPVPQGQEAQDASIRARNAALLQVASTFPNATVVDIYSALKPNWPALTDDGTHYNPAGRGIVAAEINRLWRADSQ